MGTVFLVANAVVIKRQHCNDCFAEIRTERAPVFDPRHWFDEIQTKHAIINTVLLSYTV